MVFIATVSRHKPLNQFINEMIPVTKKRMAPVNNTSLAVRFRALLLARM